MNTGNPENHVPIKENRLSINTGQCNLDFAQVVDTDDSTEDTTKEEFPDHNMQKGKSTLFSEADRESFTQMMDTI